MRPIKIGCIGLGGIAQGVHLPQTERSPALVLSAICDIDAEKLNAVGEKYGIDKEYRFADYRDLIASPDIDAVDICTPNDNHFEIALTAAKAGKSYSLEKPITLTAKQAELLAEETRRTGVKSMVCFSYRYKAAARYARELLVNGTLGKLYHVSMQYYQDWGLPDNHCPLVWRFIRERTGSGALGDLGSHALDLVQFVTGLGYEKLISQAGTFVKERPLPDSSGKTGVCDVDDYINILACMEEGLSADFQISRFCHGRGNYQRMEVYGSRGSLVYTLDAKPDEDELEVCLGHPMGETHTYTRLPIPHRFCCVQMQAFADLLAGRGDGFSATIEDGLRNQRLLDAAVLSFEQEKWVNVKETRGEVR